MKKLLMLVMLLPLNAWAGWGYKIKTTPDGNGGVNWKCYKHGHLIDEQHLDANMWATLQRHWKTGEPLEDCSAMIAKQVAEGKEKEDAAWHERHEKELAILRAQDQAEQQRRQAEQLRQEVDTEKAFLSDAMYTSLWNELYEYESKEYYKYGDRGDKSKWRHAYGDAWLSLSYASRKEWYSYLFPKISFGEISEWSERAHVKAEEERQQYMRDMDAAGRDGGGGSSGGGGEN